MDRVRATVKWDFRDSTWVAEFDGQTDGPYGSGDTPQEAVESLQRQACKHDLWPVEEWNLYGLGGR
jgi:hypothetical protein